MSSRTRLFLPVAALTVIALLTAAPRAHACTPLPEGVFSTIPADGQKYPGNAAVILQGQGISLTDASVTVDGKPATLKDAHSTPGFSDSGFFGVFVEPAPAVGQSVVIAGTFCMPGSGCPPVTLHYQATAASDQFPEPVKISEIDVHDYPDFKSSGGDCQSDSDFALWLHLESPIPDQATAGVVLYEITGIPGFGGEPDFVARGIVTAEWNPRLAIRRLGPAPQGQPPPDWKSFSVMTFYSTGYGAPHTVSPTGICHYRTDMVPTSGFPPAEPMWTAADIYPDGPCDATMGTGSASAGAGGQTAGDQVVGGCGCSVAGEDEPISGIFGALVLALGATMRIVRRRR